MRKLPAKFTKNEIGEICEMGKYVCEGCPYSRNSVLITEDGELMSAADDSVDCIITSAELLRVEKLLMKKYGELFKKLFGE